MDKAILQQRQAAWDRIRPRHGDDTLACAGLWARREEAKRVNRQGVKVAKGRGSRWRISEWLVGCVPVCPSPREWS